MHQFRMKLFKPFWEWTKNTSSSRALGFFSPKIFPSYLPPLSYLLHLISYSCHLQSLGKFLSLSNTKLPGNKMWEIRLEEGGELNVERMWRGKNKRSISSQMWKWKKKSKFPLLFSIFFFSSLRFFFFFVFFFVLLLLEKKKMPGKKNLKQKGRRRKASGSQKFFMFFFLSLFIYFFCLRKRRCKDKPFETKGHKWVGRSRSQKWEGKMGAWRKTPSLFYIFVLLYGFLLCFILFYFVSEEQDVRRKHLTQKDKNRNQNWNGKAWT